jgi:GNAT superfamily N-acetyltransferase
MKTADLSIGAGGISVWERAYFGLPTITIEVAENQSQQIKDAAAHGFVYSPDLQDDDWEVSLAHHITALANNYRLRELLSKNSQKIVDGKGVSRVVDQLSQTIFIRKATLHDVDLLFHWRNHSAIRAVSKNIEPIVYENHTAWFMKTIQSTEHQILIATLQDGQEVGVIRFDQHDTSSEISIYLAPDQHRQGIGSELLRLGEQWMLENCQWVQEFRAIVLGENLASHRLFEKAAYSKDETIYFKKVKYES